MFKLPSAFAISGVVVMSAFITGAPAWAASPSTYISSKGANTGDCSNPSKPCRTIAYALKRTSAFGEIKALNPAHYGGATIKNSVSIAGTPGATASVVKINTGNDEVVNISQFAFEGAKTKASGVFLKSGGKLNIIQCSFRNFVSNGIHLEPKNDRVAHVSIVDVTTSNNGNAGIYINMQETATLFGVIERVLMHANQAGFIATRSSNDANAFITIKQSTSSGNDNYGFLSGAQGDLRLIDSVSTDNNYGVFVNTQAKTAGTNFIFGNTTNIAGGMGSVPLQ